MKFFRRTNTYTPVSKRKALRLLQDQDWIDSISKKRNFFIIKTKPICPHFSEFRKKIIEFPIGSYIITIKESLKKLKIISILNEFGSAKVSGKIGWHHGHICTRWSDPLCWGNVTDEVDLASSKKDLFFLVKYCGELLHDGNDENDRKDEVSMDRIIDTVYTYYQYKFVQKYIRGKKVSKMKDLWHNMDNIYSMGAD